MLPGWLRKLSVGTMLEDALCHKNLADEPTGITYIVGLLLLIYCGAFFLPRLILRWTSTNLIWR